MLSVEFDSTEAEKRATSLTKLISDLSEQRKALNKAIRENRKEQTALNQSIAEQQSKLSGLIAAGKQNTKEYADASAELTKMQTRLKQVNDQQDEYFRQVNEVSNAQKVARRELNLLNKEAQAATGSLNQQRAQLAQLNRAYDQFRVGVDGSADDLGDLERKIQSLTDEISAQEEATGRFQRNVGNYAGGIRDAFASAIPGGQALTAALATPAGLVAGVVAGVAAGGKALFDLQQRIEAQRKEVQLTTEATGAALDELTAKTAASAQTFGQDFNQVLQATNTLTRELGGDFTDNSDAIAAGLSLAGERGAELLDIVQEYPAQFRGSSISANQFIAIASQSLQEGVFSDKGVDAIKEAEIRIRELTPATRSALDTIGISSVELEERVRSGTTTIFEEIQGISGRLSELPPQSVEVGTAIADIFGGAGEDAGLRYITTLQNINTNLNETLENSSDFARQQLELQQVNAQLEQSFNELFAGSDGFFTELQIGAKELLATLIQGLLPAIRFVIEGVTKFIMVVRSLPEFVRENKVEIAALAAALVAFNAQAIAAAANSLRAAAVQKGLTIATKAQAIAQRILNGVMRANPIGLVVSAVALLVGAFVKLYKSSQTVRAGIAGTFNAIKQVASNILGVLVDQFLGFKNILAGVFTLDLDQIKAGAEQFARGVKNQFTGLGEGVVDAFNEGYDSKIEAEAEEAARKASQAVTNPDLSVATQSGEETGAAFIEGMEKAVSGKSVSADIQTATSGATSETQPEQDTSLRTLEAQIKTRLALVEAGTVEELNLLAELEKVKLDKALQNEKLLQDEKILLETEYQIKVQEIEDKKLQIIFDKQTEALDIQQSELERARANQTITEEEYTQNVLRIQVARLQGELTQLEYGSAAFIRKQAEIAEKQAELRKAITEKAESPAEIFEREQLQLQLAQAQGLIAEEEYTDRLLAIRQKRLEAELAQLEQGSNAYIQKQLELIALQKQIQADAQAEGGNIFGSIEEQLDQLQVVSNAFGEYANTYLSRQEEMIDAEVRRGFINRGVTDASEEDIQREIELKKQQSSSYKRAKNVAKAAAISDILIARAQQIQQVSLAAAKIAATFPPPAGPILAGVYVAANVATAIAQTRQRLSEIQALEAGGFAGDGQPMNITYKGQIVKRRRSFKEGGNVNRPTVALVGEEGAEYVAPNRQIRKYPGLFGWLNRERQGNPGPFPALASGGYTGAPIYSPVIPAYVDGGLTARASQTAALQNIQVNAALDLRDSLENMPPPVVTVEDINAGQSRKATVDNSANF